MKRVGIFVAALLAVAVGFRVAPAFADTLATTSDKLTTVAADQTVDGSAYLAGQTVTVAGMVKGDVYCAGVDVTITGTVEGDVLCAGRDITVSGTVHGNVRAAAMNITVKGAVDGSVSLAGTSIVTDSASKIGRDASVTGAHVTLSGTVTRDVVAASSSVALDGIVGRDVSGTIDHLSATGTAKVAGNLTYVSDNDANLPSGVVAGKVTRTLPPTQEGYFGRSRMGFSALVGLAFIMVLSFVILALLIALVAPQYVQRVSTLTTWQSVGLAFLIGLVSLVVVPVCMMLLALTVLGAYAAFVLGVAYLLCLLIGAALVAYRVGQFMLPGKTNVVLAALMGGLVLGILCIIPLIGWVIAFIATMIGVGIIVLGMKDQYVAESVVVEEKPVKKIVAQKKSKTTR